MRGHTLLEVLIAGVLLVVMLGLVLSTYAGGAGAMRKVETQSELQSQAQVLCMRLGQDLEWAAVSSLTLRDDGHAVSFLDPASGVMTLTPDTMQLTWDHFVIYYLDQGDVWRREVSLPPDAPERLSPGPLETFGPSLPLQSYCQEGTRLARGATDFTLSTDGERLLNLSLALSQRRYGKTDPDVFRLQSGFRLRN